MKIIAQGFRADHCQERMALRRGGGQKIHRAKAACVVEGDARAALHVQHHMVMFGGCRVMVMKLAQLRP